MIRYFAGSRPRQVTSHMAEQSRRGVYGDDPLPGKALYLIGYDPDGPTKVGISDRPEERLAQLQSAHHRKLFIYGWYRFRSPGQAEMAEKWVLKDHQRDKRLEGEWVKTGARELSPVLKDDICFKFGQEWIVEWEESFVVWSKFYEEDELDKYDCFGEDDQGNGVVGTVHCSEVSDQSAAIAAMGFGV